MLEQYLRVFTSSFRAMKELSNDWPQTLIHNPAVGPAQVSLPGRTHNYGILGGLVGINSKQYEISKIKCHFPGCTGELSGRSNAACYVPNYAYTCICFLQ